MPICMARLAKIQAIAENLEERSAKQHEDYDKQIEEVAILKKQFKDADPVVLDLIQKLEDAEADAYREVRTLMYNLLKACKLIMEMSDKHNESKEAMRAWIKKQNMRAQQQFDMCMQDQSDPGLSRILDEMS